MGSGLGKGFFNFQHQDFGLGFLLYNRVEIGWWGKDLITGWPFYYCGRVDMGPRMGFVELLLWGSGLGGGHKSPALHTSLWKGMD